jgi:hypothetical protein
MAKASGVSPSAARRCSWLGLPTGDRCGREPNYQAPAITQGCIILPPVRDPMTLAGNVASAFRMKLERHIHSRHENRKPFAPAFLKIQTHQHRCNKIASRL